MSPEVTVIGCDGRPFGPEAAEVLIRAERVVGAPRHLGAAPIPESAQRLEIKHLDEALDALAADQRRTVVLASGDPGFFGIVRALRARGIRPAVIPAVSSVALAFARLGLDWDDALVVSAHGRDPRYALAAALAHPKAAILTAPGTARDLGRTAAGRGQDGVRRRMPRRPAGTPHRPGRRTLRATPPTPTSSSRWTSKRRARPAGWPATRAPRTAGRCPRTRSSTATR